MPEGTCSLPECDRKVYCRQMCKPHYEASRGYDQSRAKPASCDECGADYMKARGARTGTCPPCARRAQAEGLRTRYPKCNIYFPECSNCGRRFPTGNAARIYCTDSCLRETAAQRAGYRDQSCRSCGQTRAKWSTFCEDCITAKRKATKAKARKHRRSAGLKSDNDRRRARRYGVEYEPVSRPRVYERDEWICGICSSPVEKSLHYPDARSASLDHVIPLARGGGHTYSNVQCAHLDCNVRKGAALVTPTG